MARKILSEEFINQMRYEAYKEESMKNKKKGSPVDHMLDINDENSILSSYIKRKTEEYNMAMENFEDDFEEKKIKFQKRQLNGEDEGEEEVSIGGVGSYKTDDSDDEYESDKIIKLDIKEENINPNNIIDDLL